MPEVRLTGRTIEVHLPPGDGAGLDPANARAVECARLYLHEHYAEPVRLAELVRLTGLSRFHLAHLFTRYTGLPPHAYQILVRIERARALLLAGIPAVEVAGLVGFADQSHFTRHFRRIWRVTPGSYLRTVRAKSPPSVPGPSCTRVLPFPGQTQ
jgi:AraC-like DNA-binding protein